MLGLVAFKEKNKAVAIQEFEAALGVDPSHYWSLLWLGFSLCDLGEGHERDEAVRVDADVQPILGQFLASRRELLEQLELAAARDERGEVRRIAHLLAGSFALYGFGWASERSRWLEGSFTEIDAAAVRAWAGDLREHLDTVDIRFENAQA